MGSQYRQALMFVKNVRQQRQPVDSTVLDTRRMNTLISKCGKKANRTNSVMATSNRRFAEDFGTVFAVVPIGRFNYTWCLTAQDWVPRHIFKPKVLKDPCQYILGDDNTLQDAIESGNEIMIKCGSILGLHPIVYSKALAILNGGAS